MPLSSSKRKYSSSGPTLNVSKPIFFIRSSASSQDVARVALVRGAVGLDDVADHAADLGAELVAVLVDRPRHQLERRRVGDRDHVRLLDRVEAGDRRAVEAHPVVERALHLVRRDRERLQVALEVREPEEDVLDPLVLDPLQHRAPRGDARRRPILALHHASCRASALRCSAVSPSRTLLPRRSGQLESPGRLASHREAPMLSQRARPCTPMLDAAGAAAAITGTAAAGDGRGEAMRPQDSPESWGLLSFVDAKEGATMDETIERRRPGCGRLMTKFKLEYIWLDGYEPVPNLRGKTKIEEFDEFPDARGAPALGLRRQLHPPGRRQRLGLHAAAGRDLPRPRPGRTARS